MKSIYILLTKSDTYISKIINLATSDPYTHVSISFNENLEPMYSFCRKYVNYPLPAGLQTESLKRGFFKKYNYIPCALYELKVEDEVYDAATAEVARMMKEASTYRFSIIGLLLCKFNIPHQREHHYFCSQFVGEILTRSKAVTLPKEPSLMKPNDYATLPHLTCCFEGRMNQLAKKIRKAKKKKKIRKTIRHKRRRLV